MTELTHTTLDKSGWGDGPWQDEPDKVQWQDEATGLACLAVRGPGGHWCGYVGVPPGHPAFEKDYDAAHALFGEWDADTYLHVHGGLTFADHCHEGPEETSICHVPAPGESDNVWWLGFDCAHSGDYSPAHAYRDRELAARDPEYAAIMQRLAASDRGDKYRTLAYVKSETAHLADQLAAVPA